MKFSLTKVASARTPNRGGANAPDKCDRRRMCGNHHNEIRKDWPD